MAKITIESELYERLTDCSVIVGYSSVAEFIIHVLEKEAALIEEAEDDQDVKERLKGLGYIS
jgi:predicted CopG family antitoxin